MMYQNRDISVVYIGSTATSSSVASSVNYSLLSFQDAPFLYGLGIVYFHFNAYQWYVRISNIYKFLAEVKSAINLLVFRFELF